VSDFVESIETHHCRISRDCPALIPRATRTTRTGPVPPLFLFGDTKRLCGSINFPITQFHSPDPLRYTTRNRFLLQSTMGDANSNTQLVNNLFAAVQIDAPVESIDRRNTAGGHTHRSIADRPRHRRFGMIVSPHTGVYQRSGTNASQKSPTCDRSPWCHGGCMVVADQVGTLSPTVGPLCAASSIQKCVSADWDTPQTANDAIVPFKAEFPT